MKNIEIKKALQNELKHCDYENIFIRWYEFCDGGYVEISTLINKEENKWGEGYYIDGIDDLKYYEEMTNDEIKAIHKKIKSTYNYLKKHFDKVEIDINVIYI